MVQEVVRDALLAKGIQRRRLKRQSQRNDTEMAAARLTGTHSPEITLRSPFCIHSQATGPIHSQVMRQIMGQTTARTQART